MKSILILLTLVFLEPLLLQQQRGWRGIVPLRSTRSDVESSLGTSSEPCKCLYKTEDAVVFVEYARGSCKGALHGWNVPPDTVVSLTVQPNAGQRSSNLVDLNKLEVRQDDTLTKYYLNRDTGIEYTVSTDGVVTAVSYVPSSNDSHLRCSGASASNRQGAIYPPFDNYSDIPTDDEKDRLDAFAVQLHQNPSTTGYVIVYPGPHTATNEAKARAERTKNYLVNKRGIEVGRIVTIDGGHRRDFVVELYVVAGGSPAPVAIPTIKSIKGGRATKNRRSVQPRRKQPSQPCP